MLPRRRARAKEYARGHSSAWRRSSSGHSMRLPRHPSSPPAAGLKWRLTTRAARASRLRSSERRAASPPNGQKKTRAPLWSTLVRNSTLARMGTGISTTTVCSTAARLHDGPAGRRGIIGHCQFSQLRGDSRRRVAASNAAGFPRDSFSHLRRLWPQSFLRSLPEEPAPFQEPSHRPSAPFG